MRIENCNSFCIPKNGCPLIVLSDGLMSLDGVNSKRLSMSIRAVNLLNRNILVSKNDSGDKVILDEFLNIVEEFNSGEDNVLSAIDEDKFIHQFYTDSYSKLNFSLFDVKDLQNVWTTNVRALQVLVKGNNLFVYDSSAILSLNALTGYLNWSYEGISEFSWPQKSIYENRPLEEKRAEVVKLLGVYEGVLWVVLNRGSLLGIDIKNGKPFKHILEGKEVFENSEHILNAWFQKDTILDKKGKIINFYEGYYQEYDINNKEDFFLFSIYSDASTDDGLKFNRIGDYDESFVYCWEGGTSNRFGVFNRKNKRIDWSGKIEEAEGLFPAILDVKHQNDKLYVLDGRNTLHVLEITNSIRESQINS